MYVCNNGLLGYYNSEKSPSFVIFLSQSNTMQNKIIKYKIQNLGPSIKVKSSLSISHTKLLVRIKEIFGLPQDGHPNSELLLKKK